MNASWDASGWVGAAPRFPNGRNDLRLPSLGDPFVAKAVCVSTSAISEPSSSPDARLGQIGLPTWQSWLNPAAHIVLILEKVSISSPLCEYNMDAQ
jgi:hypothetical protein